MFNLKSQRIDIFKKVYPFLKGERHLYALLGGMKLWALLLSIIGPMLYLVLINRVMIDKQMSLLPLVIMGYIGIYLLQTLGIVINKRIYNKLFVKFNLKIKTQILSIFTKMDVSTYAKYTVGDLKNRIDSDVAVIEKFFNTHILDYFYAVASAIIIAVILLFMNWILALTGLVMVPISFWFVKIMRKRANKVSEQQRKLQGEYESFLHVTFQNWKQIKANNLQESRNEVLQDFRGNLSKLFVKKQIYWYINRAFIAFKDFFITRMNLYFIGGLLIINGRMDVGLLLAFMNYYAQFFNNIASITESLLGLKNDAPSIERTLEIINTEIHSKPVVKGLGDSISLKNLCFRYQDEQPIVLDNVSFSVNPKEHIAIVGRSGCGKTTLSKLIMGLYEPLSGTICIGDTDINTISFESIGRKIGIVLQNPPLFNLTIRENLQFAKKQASDDELMSVCKKANIYDFVDSLPKRFDTIIGERGIKLSGGQKQRLSIARTLLQNPDIIIFDEATNSLDSENEKAIVGAINELSKGKTVITIAHRLSTILDCDRVVIMDSGKVTAIDTHENLRGKNELYDLLFEQQYSFLSKVVV
jgi:ATP-binding cassette subfamily B protein/subfamily B ATP-binding cassette protein MsbA